MLNTVFCCLLLNEKVCRELKIYPDQSAYGFFAFIQGSLISLQNNLRAPIPMVGNGIKMYETAIPEIISCQ